jgi:hypothetical protein
MSEHREHLLPDTEDISCRGALIVGLHAGLRQRIYLCCGAGITPPRAGSSSTEASASPGPGRSGRRSTAPAPATAAHRIDNLFRSLPGAWGSVILGALCGDGLATPRGWRS